MKKSVFKCMCVCAVFSFFTATPASAQSYDENAEEPVAGAERNDVTEFPPSPPAISNGENVSKENWAVDARPFKRRTNGAKAVQSFTEPLETPQQMRKNFGSPHEMSSVPERNVFSERRNADNAKPERTEAVAPSYNASAFSAQPQYGRPQGKNIRPVLATTMPKRGGAGGKTRPQPVAAPAPQFRKPTVAQKKPATPTEAATTKEPAQAKETEKKQLVQEGLKMFDEETAQSVMDIQPISKDLEKLSPSARKKLLDSISVNEKTNQDSAGTKDSSSKKSRKNAKDNPYK